jgi:hypothetical protein
MVTMKKKEMILGTSCQHCEFTAQCTDIAKELMQMRKNVGLSIG